MTSPALRYFNSLLLEADPWIIRQYGIKKHLKHCLYEDTPMMMEQDEEMEEEPEDVPPEEEEPEEEVPPEGEAPEEEEPGAEERLSEIQKIYFLKKIYGKLIAIEKILDHFSSSTEFDDIRDANTEALGYFHDIINNYDMVKDKIDDIIRYYTKYIREVAKEIVVRYNKLKRKRERELTKRLKQSQRAVKKITASKGAA